MKKKIKKSEYETFERAVDSLLKVPHGEIKRRLDEEKAAKKRKRGTP